MATAARNNEPKVAFDFQLIKNHKNFVSQSMGPMFKQLKSILMFNREESGSPFQIYLCNYRPNADSFHAQFHERYSRLLNFDQSLVQETDKSYLDLFPRGNLVYLSRDSKTFMSHFDPDKVYIIGALVDNNGTEHFEHTSLKQAVRDRIRVEALPVQFYAE